MIESITVNITSTRCLCGASVDKFSVGITEIDNDIKKQEIYILCRECGIRISRPMDNMKVNVSHPSITTNLN